jgi:hypothetical protein
MKQRSAVANYEYNRNTTVGIPVETHNLCVFTTPTRPSSPTRDGNPSGLSRPVEGVRPCRYRMTHPLPPLQRGRVKRSTRRNAERSIHIYTVTPNHVSPPLWGGVGGEVKRRPTQLPVSGCPFPSGEGAGGVLPSITNYEL